MSERDVASPMPWVCLPGQALPHAPPLWARFSREDRLVEVVREEGDPIPESHAVATLGWLKVVDAEGRSR